MGKKISQEEIVMALVDISFFKSAGATSLSDIADKLGIKKASLYNHFENREAIVEGAFKFCSDYLGAINILPPDLNAVTKKYSAASVIKGIMDRYFKMHEKKPLFQIYTFVESQKYFSRTAAEIIARESRRFESQTEKLFDALMSNGKIYIPSAYKKGCIQWLCNGINSILSATLMQRKRMVMENPASGEGELFSLPPESNLDDFTRRIG